MERARAEAMRRGRYDDLGPPILALAGPTGEQLLGLSVPGIHPSEQAKVILVASQATHAACCLESWQVAVPPPPEIAAQMEAGVPLADVELPPMPRASQHPDRIETLTLIGQVYGQTAVMRSWLIGRPRKRGAARIFTPRDLDGMTLLPSRFNPLFPTDDEGRDLAIRLLAQMQLAEELRERRS